MNTQKIYEIGMLINPDLSQQEADKTVENIKEILTKNSASVISQGEIVKIDLAYEIILKIASKNERFNEANFTWVKFESEALSIDKIKNEIDKIKNEVFRYLITKTIKDDLETDTYGNSLEEVENEDAEIEVEEIEEGNTVDEAKEEVKNEEENKNEPEIKEEGFLSKITKKIKGD